jgi:hypothetical protein
LATSGSLDTSEGGHPVDISTRPYKSRLTVYSFVERLNLPGIFRTFDFASPDSTSPQRFNTTVPQQALFMINSPFLIEQTRTFLQRPEVKGAGSEKEKIKALYQVAFQRGPSKEELAMAEEFIGSQSKTPAPEPRVEVWQYGYGELDPASHKVMKFTKFPHWTGEAWQGSGSLPDGKLGWLMLNATGGHPGEGISHVVVRRWVAPFDCNVAVSGALEHSTDAGDGVRGHIISSRLGELGFWPVYNSKREMGIAQLEIKKGDTVDFAVDSNQNLNSDSFTWVPRIKALSQGASAGSGSASEWNARQEFSGPKEVPAPLNAWEQYAQVLLMSNELAFVD